MTDTITSVKPLASGGGILIAWALLVPAVAGGERSAILRDEDNIYLTCVAGAIGTLEITDCAQAFFDRIETRGFEHLAVRDPRSTRQPS